MAIQVHHILTYIFFDNGVVLDISLIHTDIGIHESSCKVNTVLLCIIQQPLTTSLLLKDEYNSYTVATATILAVLNMELLVMKAGSTSLDFYKERIKDDTIMHESIITLHNFLKVAQQ